MKNKVFSVAGYILLAIVIFCASTILPMASLTGLNMLGNLTSLPKNYFDENLNLSYVLVSVVLIGVFGFFFYLFKRREKVTKVLLSLPQKVIVVILGAFGVSGISLLWMYFFDKVLLKLLPLQASMDSFNQSMDSMEKGPLIWVFLGICVVGPILEEIMFRGLLFKSLERAFRNPTAAIIVSGLLFGLWHGSLVQSVFTASMGIVLAYVYHKTKNLWFPILIHMINNMISFPIQGAQGPLISDILNYACLVLIIPFIIVFVRMFSNKMVKAESEPMEPEANSSISS